MTAARTGPDSGELPTTSEPLRVGVLGAARIAELALVEPARSTGTRLVAIFPRHRVSLRGATCT
jgi:predicted dehydrogenase